MSIGVLKLDQGLLLTGKSNDLALRGWQELNRESWWILHCHIWIGKPSYLSSTLALENAATVTSQDLSWYLNRVKRQLLQGVRADPSA
jgi:hypothetical protein